MNYYFIKTYLLNYFSYLNKISSLFYVQFMYTLNKYIQMNIYKN